VDMDRANRITAEDRAALAEAAGPLIELAIAEDIGPGDATSLATLPPDLLVGAHILAKAPGIVAGLPVVAAVFRRIEPCIEVECLASDGDVVRRGDIVAAMNGPARGMLAAERTALNFLQHLSGIATLTAAFVEAVAGTGAAILDTRKTHPGYRRLEKYAVRAGGGRNHRLGLHDMLLIKDNHIEAAGSISSAVRLARAAYPALACEVEVKDLEELREALGLAVEQIMLDNMDLDTMRAAVAIAAGRAKLEASGNVTLSRVAAIAATGVDLISIGALTHSAPCLDFSLDVIPQITQPAASAADR
jgi:nicotinate-nucleotide pyrophosphorylase (carboxylating)